MTDTNGAAQSKPDGDTDPAVPAAGGTFGVTSDQSSFSERPLPGADEYDASIDLGQVEEAAPQDPAVPASGGTFGVTEDRSGYVAPGGSAEARPGIDGYGTPPAVGYGGFSQPTENPEMAPPQFGAPATKTAKPDVVAYVALGLGILSLLLLLIPGWAWIAAGVLGVVAIVIGAMRLRGAGRLFAMFGMIAGGLAVLLAIATAIVVYFV